MGDQAGDRSAQPGASGFSPPRSVLLIAAALVPAQIFLFNVTSVAAGNARYWGQPLYQLVAPSLAPFLILVGLTYVAVRMGSLPFQRAFICIASGVFLLLWLQGQVLVWDYGALTGETIDWAEYFFHGIAEYFIWFSILSGLILLRHRIWRFSFNLAACVAGIQVVLGIYALTIQNESHSISGYPETSYSSVPAFSKQHNILHIVLDGFQSDILEQILEESVVREQVRDTFQGFTFFNETLGVFPYTQFSVPAYLSASIYDNSVQKEEFIDHALASSSIPGLAKKNGYRVDLAVSGPYMVQRHANIPHDSIYDINEFGLASKRTRYTVLLWDLSIFRSVPHFLKYHIHGDQRWLLSRIVLGAPRYFYPYFRHERFLESLTEQMSAELEDPVYKLIHVMNTHRPMVVDDDCSFHGAVRDDTRQSLMDQSTCTLLVISALIDGLKNLGIYRDALILIHADHGGWVASRRPNTITGLQGQPIRDEVLSLASPLLLLKPPGAEGELQSSPAPAWLMDIPDSVSTSMRWNEGFGYRSVTHLKTDELRTRYFYYYPWHRHEWNNDFTLPITMFEINGSHYDVEWQAKKIISSKHENVLN